MCLARQLKPMATHSQRAGLQYSFCAQLSPQLSAQTHPQRSASGMNSSPSSLQSIWDMSQAQAQLDSSKV